MDEQPTSPAPQITKSTWHPANLLLPAGMLVVAIALAFGVHTVVNWYTDRSASTATVICRKSGVSHAVMIHSGVADPATTYGKLCDTLTITNYDPKLRAIAFGPHDHHVAYNGVTEQVLSEGQNMTIIMDEAGTYTFHDHVDDSSVGTFIVSR